jgi:hypothetical protein
MLINHVQNTDIARPAHAQMIVDNGLAIQKIAAKKTAGSEYRAMLGTGPF